MVRSLCSLLFCALACSACRNSGHEQYSRFCSLSGITPEDTIVCLYVFLADCVISEAGHKKIRSLHEEYSHQGVYFQALFPTKHSEEEARKELDAILLLYAINFPVLIDTGAVLSGVLDVSTAPTVLLYHQGKEVYRGAIDDEFYDLGRKKRSPAIKQYLREAIVSTMEGKKPLERQTKSIGCVFR